MVAILALLPKQKDLNHLATMHETIQVFERKNLVAGASKILLEGKRGCIAISTHSADLVSKFEIFTLTFDLSPSDIWSDPKEIARFEGWETIRCLFRFDWDREALSGEVPEDLEQSVSGRGRRTEVPDAAIAIGISMVGIAFCKAGNDVPVGSIMASDDMPATLAVFQTRESMESAMADCECVNLQNIPEWMDGLSDWIQARKRMNP